MPAFVYMSLGEEIVRKKRANLPSLSEDDKWAGRFQCCIAYYDLANDYYVHEEIEKKYIGDSSNALVHGSIPSWFIGRTVIFTSFFHYGLPTHMKKPRTFYRLLTEAGYGREQSIRDHPPMLTSLRRNCT